MSSKKTNFLVTGCGRSGTTYTSKLLTFLGIPCSHELLFTIPVKTMLARPGAWSQQFVGEASWWAAPFVCDLPTDVVVLHQVRDPIKVARSFLRIKFFEQESNARTFVDKELGNIIDQDQLMTVLRYWNEWNALAENTKAGAVYKRYKIEDIDIELDDILRLIDVDLPFKERLTALESVPRTINTSGTAISEYDVLTWESIPNNEITRAVKDRAIRYGYEV